MNVVLTLALWGGIALAVAVIALFSVLVLHQRMTRYEGEHRFRDDEHVITSEAYYLGSEDDDYR